MIDRALAIAGLGLAIISPVFGTVFPNIHKKWAIGGFIVGLLFLGAALGTWLLPAGAGQGTTINVPGNGNIVTEHQSGGNNTINNYGPPHGNMNLYDGQVELGYVENPPIGHHSSRKLRPKRL